LRCQITSGVFEKLAGAALEETGPAALSDDALTKTMARLLEPEPAQGQVRSLDALLRTARRRHVAPGIWVAKIDTPHERYDRVYLLGAMPNVATAKHSHEGYEFTHILRGALADGETVFRAGDFVACDTNVTHHPHATGDEECVCLIATHKRLTPASWIGRLAFMIADV
jgi:putative transcriptional regulator